jgi:type I restriction enzyme, S subunit
MITFSDSRNIARLSWASQWDGVRLKYGVKLINDKAETVFNYVGLENVESWTGRLIQNGNLPDSDEKENAATGNKFYIGNILFGKLRPYLAKVFVAEEYGCCTSELLVFHPLKYDSNYLKYLILTPDFVNLVNSSTYGAKMPRASWDFIGNIFLPTPHLQTQKSIASFLDRKTANIDTLIAKKQRLIQLLEEKRTALINQAVTKGLNHNAPMKDSGIPWIGAVPQYWEVIPLKYITSLSGGSTPDKSNIAYWNGSIPWISAKDMKRFLIGESIDYITELATQETSIRIIQPPVILVVVRGMILAHSFPVAITTNPLTVNQDIKTITCSDKTIIEFLARHLSACKDGVLSLIQEAGHGTKALRTDLFEKLPILLPPIQEQQEICSYVSNHSKKFADIILCLNKQIEKLQEYRRSLITAAVTGKLDISEVTSDYAC